MMTHLVGCKYYKFLTIIIEIAKKKIIIKEHKNNNYKIIYISVLKLSRFDYV